MESLTTTEQAYDIIWELTRQADKAWKHGALTTTEVETLEKILDAAALRIIQRWEVN